MIHKNRYRNLIWMTLYIGHTDDFWTGHKSGTASFKECSFNTIFWKFISMIFYGYLPLLIEILYSCSNSFACNTLHETSRRVYTSLL